MFLFSDLISIPDFVSGAMEHWGLVTFRETSVLYNSLISSSSNQFQVSLTVAHELAHMWFGDLGDYVFFKMFFFKNKKKNYKNCFHTYETEYHFILCKIVIKVIFSFFLVSCLLVISNIIPVLCQYYFESKN